MIHTESTHYSKTLVVSMTIIDSLLFFVSFKTAYWLEFQTFPLPVGYYQALLVVCLLSWIVASLFRGAYHPGKLKSLSRITRSSLSTMMPHAILVAAYVYLVDTVIVPTNFMMMAHTLFLLVSVFAKYSLLALYTTIRNRKENRSRTIIVGYTNAGRELYHYFKKDKKAGFEFLGFFDDRQDHPLISGKLGDVKDFCLQHRINEMYCALPSNHPLIKELTEFADNNFIHFGLVQDLSGLSYDRLHTFHYGNEIPVLSYSKEPAKSSSKIYDGFSVKLKNLPFSS